MNKKASYPFFLLFAVLLYSSCEKVVDLKLKESSALLVIEGNITNEIDTQGVKISQTTLFSDPNVFPAVATAVVTVKDDDGIVYNFRYRGGGIYSSRRFKGIPGHTYSLKVVNDGTEYTATSTMPSQVAMDSIGVLSTSVFGNERKSVQLLFKDPAGVPNYYRFALKINGIRSSSIFVFSDDFNDGKNVTRELVDFDTDLKSGDKIDIEVQGIDAVVYRYWMGLDQNSSRGGASTTPANPVTNISNGALGYFSAHTKQSESLFIP